MRCVCCWRERPASCPGVHRKVCTRCVISFGQTASQVAVRRHHPVFQAEKKTYSPRTWRGRRPESPLAAAQVPRSPRPAQGAEYGALSGGAGGAKKRGGGGSRDLWIRGTFGPGPAAPEAAIRPPMQICEPHKRVLPCNGRARRRAENSEAGILKRRWLCASRARR